LTWLHIHGGRLADMPAKDRYHAAVRAALIKEGWTITHDPFSIDYAGEDLFIDLGAERLLAAEKGEQRIAVEVKSFIGISRMADLREALGQYILYRDVLEEIEPERELYLAIPEDAAISIFDAPIGQLVLQKEHTQIIVFDPNTLEITRWIV
jgi:hypothetical protein